MKKLIIVLFLIFLNFSCFKADENKTIISKELENKNVQNNVNHEKNKSIKLDFQKDLDEFLETNSWSEN